MLDFACKLRHHSMSLVWCCEFTLVLFANLLFIANRFKCPFRSPHLHSSPSPRLRSRTRQHRRRYWLCTYNLEVEHSNHTSARVGNGSDTAHTWDDRGNHAACHTSDTSLQWAGRGRRDGDDGRLESEERRFTMVRAELWREKRERTGIMYDQGWFGQRAGSRQELNNEEWGQNKHCSQRGVEECARALHDRYGFRQPQICQKESIATRILRVLPI